MPVHLAQTLERDYQSQQSGPLCCLLLTALAEAQGQESAKYAARGLERLSLDDFRRDYRPLLAEGKLAHDAGGLPRPSEVKPDDAAALAACVGQLLRGNPAG